MTGRATPAIRAPRHPGFVVLITALRAGLAFAIGITLLLVPGRDVTTLAGFMGAYFLISGLFSLAWARRGLILNRLAFVSGTIGVVTGALVLAYAWEGGRVPSREALLMLVGLLVGLTGVLHVAGGFMVGERIDRWPAGHMLLGLVEIVLGVVLLFAPLRPELIETGATVWAFSAGSVLGFDAIRAHRRWSAGGVGDLPASGSSPPGQEARGG